MSATRLTVKAPAKLNLTLRITGRRSDGYHLMQSLFAFTAWGDDVDIRPASDLTLRIEGETANALNDEPDNLALRAARLLQRISGTSAGAALTLTKSIPVAAGLGGGSADAAATLRGLNTFWSLNWPAEKLEAMAVDLGADVPACIQSRPVMAEGIGEVLSPGPTLPDGQILLVNPRAATPTPAVFAAFRSLNPEIGQRQSTHVMPAGMDNVEALAAAIRPIGNDLREAAIRVSPVVQDVLNALNPLKGASYAGLSGSGATCFALFADEAQARLAETHIRATHPDWWCQRTGWAKGPTITTSGLSG
jgi:4-diphosphocytidyl-2-C-methyl-D-erythritol kinase